MTPGVPSSPKASNKRGGGASGRRESGRGPASQTPAMRQYLSQKAEVGDAILFFRMGDFYETFYEDAKTASRVLGLTLTARNKSSADPIPLAGVPYHAVDGYVARLVRAGYKVAISEQVEDPRQAKGIVKRAVDRVITPGTLTEASLLDERSDNYLAALCPAGAGQWGTGEIGLACVELASGRFFAQVLSAAAVPDELARLRPAELLVAETAIDAAPPFVEQLREVLDAAISTRPAHVFDPHLAERSLCEHFGVSSLAGFGFDGFDASLCAAAAVLDYLKETQKSALDHVLRIVPRRSDQFVAIDHVTLRSLEVERTLRDGSREGSLLWAVDKTVNPMGARRLREWLCFPARDADEIRARQGAVADLRERPACLQRLRGLLREMGDVERITARLGVGRVSPRDMVALGRALERCDELAEWASPEQRGSGDAGGDDTLAFARLPSSELLRRLLGSVGGHEALSGFLRTALKEDAPPIVRDGGFIANGFDEELDRLREIGRQGGQWLAAFQAGEAERTGIPTLKIGYNSVFGYYIEVTHQHREKVPASYVRKQTVRNAERYITDELKRHESEVLGAADQAKRVELELFEEIRGRAVATLPQLLASAEAIATLDVLGGLAELSRVRDYCRPELVDGGLAEASSSGGGVLEIVDGRHPVLDVMLAERFVPNDCQMSGAGATLLVITGPNMSGKSTYIRQVALLTLLAQVGSFVPAKSMRWSPVDRLFARVGASDELARGRSTFMVEMVETARILNNATSRSLVILDEIGRGTSTYDGLALAWSIAEHLAEVTGCRALFATHYHELTELAERIRGVENFNVAVRESLRPDGSGRDVVFLHKIVPGATDRSYGVHVAAMAGVPASVLRRGEAILAELERRHAGRGPNGMGSGEGESGQMLLFSDPGAMPTWWRELVDRVDGVDVDRMTPIDALGLLRELQRIVQDGS